MISYLEVFEKHVSLALCAAVWEIQHCIGGLENIFKLPKPKSGAIVLISLSPTMLKLDYIEACMTDGRSVTLTRNGIIWPKTPILVSVTSMS